MLSATAEHALRAVLHLARSPENSIMASDVIAEALGAPRNYLAKTLNALAKAGVVRSTRGPTGGFALAIAPRSLTVAAVIAPFGEQARTTQCLLENRACDRQHPCTAHARWIQITDQAAAAFGRTTIADLLTSPELNESGVTPELTAPTAWPRAYEMSMRAVS